MTDRTFQEDISWLKDVAPWNMLCIFVTAPTFQFEMSQLNDFAPWNILLILVTAFTFQDDMSPSKQSVDENMLLILVTPLTSQVEMSPLNRCATWNIPFKLLVPARSRPSLAFKVRFEQPQKYCPSLPTLSCPNLEILISFSRSFVEPKKSPNRKPRIVPKMRKV